MDENELKKWERHIGKPQEFEFEDNEGNKDKFLLKPLPIEFIGDLLYVSNAMLELSQGKDENLEKGMAKAQKLIMETLKSSYPEILEEILLGFAKRHFMDLINAIFEINQFVSKTAKVEERIAQIRRNLEKKKE